MLFVNTVDAKIKACNGLICICHVVCQHKDTGICGFYTTLYIGVKTLLCIQWPLIPPRGKECTAFHLDGLAVHQSKEAALLILWDLSNYKGDCRQDGRPIPNS